MSTMKKFLKYFLVFIAFFFLSGYASMKIMKSTYKDREFNLDFNSPKLEISEFKSTKMNGYINGKLYNNTDSKLTGKYLKADFFNARGNNVGTRYIEIGDLNPGESFDINEKFNIDNVENVKLSFIDQEEKPNEKLFIEKVYEKLKLDRYRRLINNIRDGKYKNIMNEFKNGNFETILNDLNLTEEQKEKARNSLQKVMESIEKMKSEGFSWFSLERLKFPWYVWLAAMILIFG